MIYGMYLSGQGARTQTLRLETVANNLANAGTTGFRRDLAVFREANPYDIDEGRGFRGPTELLNSTGGTVASETHTSDRGGALLATGEPFDLAIAGPGFVRVDDGFDQLLTRNLRLTVNENHELVTQSHGHRVLGEGGIPIRLPSNIQQLMVAPDGMMTVRTTEGAVAALGRLELVVPDKPDLMVKKGQSLYDPGGQVTIVGPRTRVKQGFLEGPGIEPVKEMMDLIEATRMVEANINMIKYQDSTLESLISQTSPR